MNTLLSHVVRVSVVAGFLLLAGCASPVPAAAPYNPVSSTFKRPQARDLVLLLHEPAADQAFRPGDPMAAAEPEWQRVAAGLRGGRRAICTMRARCS